MIILTNNDRMGQNILHLRRKQNLSQTDFARLAGIDTHLLDAVEKGTLFEMDADVLMKICSYFDISMQDLLEGTIL